MCIAYAANSNKNNKKPPSVPPMIAAILSGSAGGDGGTPKNSCVTNVFNSGVFCTSRPVNCVAVTSSLNLVCNCDVVSEIEFVLTAICILVDPSEIVIVTSDVDLNVKVATIFVSLSVSTSPGALLTKIVTSTCVTVLKDVRGGNDGGGGEGGGEDHHTQTSLEWSEIFGNTSVQEPDA